jgi:hypothetical protein
MKKIVFLMIFVLILFDFTVAKVFNLYKLQNKFDHFVIMQGTHKFNYGDLVFEDENNYYLLSQKKNSVNGSYIYSNGIFSKKDKRITEYVKFIEKVELPKNTSFTPNNEELMVKFVDNYKEDKEKEQKYLKNIENMVLVFKIQKEQEESAWGRAQSFIDKYNSMKTQTVTNYSIQTYNPIYPRRDEVEIQLQCNTDNIFSLGAANQNAKVLGYYIKSEDNPTASYSGYGYYVVKTPMGDEIEIQVQCNTDNIFSLGAANQNAKVLAYYIKSGDLLMPELIAR